MEKVKMSTAEEELLKRILTERQEWKPTNIKEQALAEKIIKDLVERSRNDDNPDDAVRATAILLELKYRPPLER